MTRTVKTNYTSRIPLNLVQISGYLSHAHKKIVKQLALLILLDRIRDIAIVIPTFTKIESPEIAGVA